MSGDRAVGITCLLGLVTLASINLWEAGYNKGFSKASVTCPDSPKVVVAELNSDHIVCVYKTISPTDATRRVRVPRKK
jgi:hypothetical protein